MLTGMFKRWRKEQDGAAALEFAFLGIPFFFFVIGIIEVALMMANASIMEGAVYDAARMVRTVCTMSLVFSAMCWTPAPP